MFEKLLSKLGNQPRNEAVVKLIEALRRDPTRIQHYEWERLYDAVRQEAHYKDRTWMDQQRKLLIAEALLTRIAAAELTEGESEQKGTPVAPQGFYQSSLAQHVTQHQQLMNQQHAYQQAQMQAHQNMLGGHRGNP